ncbi:peptidoglycan DD-metalloendopeptidase family protein [Actinomadura sp. B10D3]|uniref:peptidoglycan DD-metalloendopeptidase family protein n=1 Tax=Actinomadura sp. B10D3 TaxID=3153557 RepID=UPI00325D5769
MARRDYGHASRSSTHASPWAETPARPSARREPKQGLLSEDPQWPEGSWWSEQPDWSERGRKASRRESKRREPKRRGGRSRAPRSSERDERPRERARWPEPPAQRDDARTDRFGARNGQAAGAEPFGERNRRPAPRPERPDPRRERPAPRAERSDLRAGRSDARTEQFDARTKGFDARTEGFGGRAGRPERDRSREFPQRGGRARRPERPRAQRRPDRRSDLRQPARPEPRRRPSTPRPGPKATPRRGRRPTDRLSIGAIVLSTAVGLSLLGIAERALLDGGPLGGSSGAVGSQRQIKPPKQGGSGGAAQPQQPAPQQPGGGGAAAPPAGPDLKVLAAEVRKLTLAQRGAAARQAYGAAPTAAPLVDAIRTTADKTWVLGTSAIPVPASSTANPEVAFYAAHWTGKEWQVGLSGGGRAFGGLLGAAPAKLMSPSEARLLNKYGALTATQATTLVNGTRAGDRLMLPWKVGDAWSMTTAEGSARPLGAVAFSGGDGRVVAAGTGRLYRFCSSKAGALVMVIHPSGLATTYYHLRNVPRLRDGSVVKRGDALGSTGTGRPCGGAEAPRAQVGFGLRRGAEAVPLAGAVIGGWTFQERANPLLGFAERGVLQVLTGGLLANLGPVPAADDSPSSSPSPGATPKDGAGSAGAPAPAAT